MEILLDRYDMDVYTLPYWLGETVFHEAVMPISNPGGTLEDIALMYKAEQIRSVIQRSGDGVCGGEGLCACGRKAADPARLCHRYCTLWRLLSAPADG